MWLKNHFLAKKLLTKPIWWFERNRPYPIRDKIFSLPPVETPMTGENILMISSGPTTLQDGCWAAKSFLENLPKGLGLIMASDNFSKESRIKKIFPDAKLLNDAYFMDEIGKYAPNVKKLATYHPMGRKLAAVLVGSMHWNMVFADADVLAFNPVDELAEAIGSLRKTGLYMQDISTMVETHTKRRAEGMGLKYPPRFSCGLMYIPKGSLDIKLADELLDVKEKITEWFPDTMVLAVLMALSHAEALPDGRYFQTSHRQFYFEKDVEHKNIAARHFTTPVRHVMYLKGMPLLWRKWARGF